MIQALKSDMVFCTFVSRTRIPTQVHHKAYAYMYLSIPQSQPEKLHTELVQHIFLGLIKSRDHTHGKMTIV